MISPKGSITGNLFVSFLRLGISSFGGPAMVAYIKDLSVSRNWLDETELKKGIVLCNSIPGAIAMQFAAYVGLKTYGVRGALASYVGFGLPAFMIMLGFSILFAEFRNFPLIISIFNGLQVIVVAIIFNAVFSFATGIKRDITNLSFVVAAGSLFWLGVSPFLVILLCALGGVLFMNAEAPAETGTDNEREYWFYREIWILLPAVIAGIIILYFADRELFELASVMLQIDFFAFGGGFSSLPLMLQKVVYTHGWMSNKTFMDGIALGQITPGPIVITATFVGYFVKGIAGAVVATMAIFTPSFLVLVAVEPLFNHFRNSKYFVKAIEGIFACFAGLILFVGIRFFIDVPWDAIRSVLGMAALIALIKKTDVLYVVILSIIVSAFLL